jgi:hypothetical protein
MTKSRTLLLTFLSTMLFSGAAWAATVPLAAAIIESVTVIQASLPGHIAGNLEIKVKDGFTIPPGVTCSDRFYITTLKSVDADKRMFALLVAAQTTKQPVLLYITDDPAFTAAAGRCSLAVVTISS